MSFVEKLKEPKIIALIVISLLIIGVILVIVLSGNSSASGDTSVDTSEPPVVIPETEVPVVTIVEGIEEDPCVATNTCKGNQAAEIVVGFTKLNPNNSTSGWTCPGSNPVDGEKNLATIKTYCEGLGAECQGFGYNNKPKAEGGTRPGNTSISTVACNESELVSSPLQYGQGWTYYLKTIS